MTPLSRKIRLWPAGALATWAGAVAIAGGSLALGAAALGEGLCVGLILCGVAALAWALREQAKTERAVARLSGDKEKSLDETVRILGARLEGLKHRTAATHPLTGLPTRERIEDAIEADIADGPGGRLLGAIRLVDFDRLASFDHDRANAALQRFALRLLSATKATHVVAQIDRDCFGIWFRGEGDLEATAAEFRALLYVASQELDDGEATLTPTVEAGVVAYPTDGADAGQLLLRVTAGLARLDNANGDVVLFEPPSREIAREAFRLEQGLVQAINEDQLTMVFQPVIDLASRRIIGAEALLRWDHPEFGPVSPARFIPIVEAIGLADRFGLWVLNAACREARRWQDDGLQDLKLAVNLSARQLLDPGLKDKVLRTLHRHGLNPKALELELTETATMTDAARTLDLFRHLRAIGISLAIDDFGSGYSSLSYLKNLPFDKLKIDREFVTEIDSRADSRAICKALIALGRGLGLSVLAEGVETAAEVEALSALGCTVFQGFYFSRPLSGDDFRRLAHDADWLSRIAPQVPATHIPVVRISA